MINTFGWVDDPGAVAAVRQTLLWPRFASTPAGQDPETLPEEACLWTLARKVLNRDIPTRNQGGVGSCVSFGTAAAVEYTMAAEIAAGEREEFRDLAQEVIYGGSRVEIGGGQINGDGSVGAWAADWCRKYGVVPRGKYGPWDLTIYSERTCRQYGSNGVPDDIEAIAKEHPVVAITQVHDVEECRRALANGYGVAVCSDRGFEMTRDKDGFAAPSGSWAHCMAILGYSLGKRPGFFIMNSWGEDWISGPPGLGEPPPGGFWADEKTVDRMLGQGDSWAFGGVTGFPSRSFRWWF